MVSQTFPHAPQPRSVSVDTETPLPAPSPSLPPSGLSSAQSRPLRGGRGSRRAPPGPHLAWLARVLSCASVARRLVGEQQHALLVGALHVAVHRRVVVNQQQLALGLLNQLLLVLSSMSSALQEVLHQVKSWSRRLWCPCPGEAYEEPEHPHVGCPREWMQLWVL